MSTRIRRWCDHEYSVLRRLYPTADWESVMRALPGRNKPAIEQRAHRLGLQRPGQAKRKQVLREGLTFNHHLFVPAEVLAERDARLEAKDLRNLTSTFFGDPAPGFSALDRQR